MINAIGNFIANNSVGGVTPTWYVLPTAQGAGDGTSLDDAFGMADLVDGSAFDSMADGDRVLFAEESTYTITAAVYIPKPLTLQGTSKTGTIIQTNSVATQLGLGLAIFYTDQSNVTFKDMTLDGRLVDDPGWTYVANSDAVLTERSSGIETKVGCQNVTIQNVHAKNMTRNGFCIRGTNITLTDVSAYNTMSANLKIGGTGEGTIGGGSGANATFNINVSGLTIGKTIAKECLEINDGSHGVVIEDFTIDGESKCPWWSLHDHGNADESNSDITVRDGSMINGGAGSTILFDMSGAANFNTDVLVEDVTLSGSLSGVLFRIKSNNSGLTLNRVTTSGVALIVYNGGVLTAPSDVTITNSDFIAGGTADNSNPGVLIRGVTDVSLQGVIVSGWANQGVQLQSNVNWTIESSGTRTSKIVDNGATLATGAAIDIISNADGVINNCQLGNELLTTSKYCLNLPASSDGLEFTNNTIMSPVLYALNGDFATCTNLTISGNTGLPNYPNVVTGYSATLQAWIVRNVALGNALPTAGQLTALDQYLTDLGSLLARHKTLYFNAFGSRGCLRVNVINPATFLRTITIGTVTSTVPWTNLLGWKSNGVSYVNDNYKTDQYAGIETDLTQYTYVSESVVAANTARLFGARVLSASGAFHEIQPQNSTTVGTRRHYNGTSVNFNNANWKGLYVLTYDGTNDVIYKDGTKTSTAATPSAPTISCDYLSGARNTASTSSGVTAAAHNSTAAQAIDGRLDRVNDADELGIRTALATLKTATTLP